MGGWGEIICSARLKLRNLNDFFSQSKSSVSRSVFIGPVTKWADSKIRAAWKVSVLRVILIHISRIRTKCGEIRSISPYSVRMRENADQNNSEYGRFLRSEELVSKLLDVPKKKSITMLNNNEQRVVRTSSCSLLSLLFLVELCVMC